ncbi:MAG: 2OG-Fe dioxygenase family protein [Calothrix sp. MO_167.B12]|nr:2OG-Fe dioxygenase family protein [Calothrix sp. MO_167.B12]
MLITSLKTQRFDCITDYALETINSINLDKIQSYFDNLPVDPYLEENYRYRRLSHFKINSDRSKGGFPWEHPNKAVPEEYDLIKLPHSPFFQSKEYNPLLGNVTREYAELDEQLILLPDFQKIIWEFFNFCRLCSNETEIGVHQIRTTTSRENIGNPVPEGIHQDGVDLVGIFCVSRDNISDGVTYLYKSINDTPMFTKILHPGEFLIFNDRQFFHFTSPIQVIGSGCGTRDVFVLTCPGLHTISDI